MTPTAWHRHAAETLRREQLHQAPGIRVVRIGDGALGWMSDGSIRADYMPEIQQFTYYLHHSKEDQEDFGWPAAGWITASGCWREVGS